LEVFLPVNSAPRSLFGALFSLSTAPFLDEVLVLKGTSRIVRSIGNTGAFILVSVTSLTLAGCLSV
jgi:predicted AAA+ superfamily ATPase